jgi:Glycosyltransferase family 10 (fucosyltransferase) C-term/Fucosyltransferase, N-terminal
MILFYNEFFGSKPLLTDLAPQDLDVFCWDRSLFADADAVVFHIPDLVLETFNLTDFLRLEKPSGQIWIAWSMESVGNYPTLITPAFLSRFDLVMSHARTAAIWCPYYPPWATWVEALNRPLPAKTEKSSVVMFQSASHNNSQRIEYARELMREIPVDSYGLILKNRSLPEIDQGRTTKLATIARYKFCLSLENALEVDYVTEKFFDPLLVGTVPVYRGAPNITGFAPGKYAFINAADFSSASELALYLKALDRDDEAYQRFLRWRREPLFPSFQADLDAVRVPPFKRLVEIVRRRSR